MRLLHAVHINLVPAAQRQLGCCPQRTSPRQFRVAHVKMQTPARHVELNHVTALHQCQRTADRRFRRNMQNHRTVGRAAHAPIRNSYHVGDPLAQHFRWQGHVANLGKSGVAFGTGTLEHHHAVFIDIELFVVDAGVQVFDAFEHHRTAAVHQQRWRRCRRFDDRSVRRQIALQYGDAGLILEWCTQRQDHFAVVTLGIGIVDADAQTIDGHGILMDQLTQFADHGGQPAGVVKVFHQVFAGRLQIEQARYLGANGVPVFQCEMDPDAPGNREQMHHGIGGAADGGVHANRIFKGFARQDLLHGEVFLDHLHNPSAGHVRKHLTACVYRRDRRIVRQ